MASIAQDPTAIDVAPDSQSEIHQKLKKAKAAGAAVRARAWPDLNLLSDAEHALNDRAAGDGVGLAALDARDGVLLDALDEALHPLRL